MWCLGTWHSGGLGSAGLMVGLDDLKGLFQPKFYDSQGYSDTTAMNKEFFIYLVLKKTAKYRSSIKF